jgi:hypothetical protein
MDIQEIKHQKAATEALIADALAGFSVNTTLTVDRIEITVVHRLGGTPAYVVELEARL